MGDIIGSEIFDDSTGIETIKYFERVGARLNALASSVSNTPIPASTSSSQSSTNVGKPLDVRSIVRESLSHEVESYVSQPANLRSQMNPDVDTEVFTNDSRKGGSGGGGGGGGDSNDNDGDREEISNYKQANSEGSKAHKSISSISNNEGSGSVERKKESMHEAHSNSLRDEERDEDEEEEEEGEMVAHEDIGEDEDDYGNEEDRLYEGHIDGAFDDEWENDDDNGYTLVYVTEQVFFSLEEEMAAHLAVSDDLQQAIESWAEAAGEIRRRRSSIGDIDSMTKKAAMDKAKGQAGKLRGGGHDDNDDDDDEEGEEIDDNLSNDIEAVQSALQGLSHSQSTTRLPTHTSSSSSSSSPSSPMPTSPIPANIAQATTEEEERRQLAEMLSSGGFSSPLPPASPLPPQNDQDATGKNQKFPTTFPPNHPLHQTTAWQSTTASSSRPTGRESISERRRSEIMGQSKFHGADGEHCFFNLRVIFQPFHTGFEEHKYFNPPKGTLIAGRYEVNDFLGQAAFSTALECIDVEAEEYEPQYVCLKVIKNNKDYFDQSLDEIKLLQYINSRGDVDKHNVLRLIDFFYTKEHLFIVSELLKQNLYEFGRHIRETGGLPYFTLPRIKKITLQVLSALSYIHSLNLIHCDIKPENIVMKSYSRCEVKLIDFGSSCFTHDTLTTYIQSRSYRAPEVILGHPYDGRIDIWSLGGVCAELLTGYVLFQNDGVATMLARITGILGPFPESVLSAGKETAKYFTLSNVAYERCNPENGADEDEDEGMYSLIYPKKTTLASRLHFPPLPPLPDGQEEEEDEAEDEKMNEKERNRRWGKPRRQRLHQTKEEHLFLEFVRSLLHLDPTTRCTADEAMRHPWFDTIEEIEAYDFNVIANEDVEEEDEEGDDEEGWDEDEDDEDEDEDEDEDDGEEDEGDGELEDAEE